MLQRLPEIAFELQTSHGLLMHGLVEDDKPGPTDRLSLEHSRRGVTQQMLPTFISGMTTRDTDARRQKHFAAFQREWPRKFLLKAVSHSCRITDCFDIIEQKGKLITLHPRDRIGGSNS